MITYDYKVVRVVNGSYRDTISIGRREQLENLLNDGYIIERVDTIKDPDGGTVNDYILFKRINKGEPKPE